MSRDLECSARNVSHSSCIATGFGGACNVGEIGYRTGAGVNCVGGAGNRFTRNKLKVVSCAVAGGGCCYWS